MTLDTRDLSIIAQNAGTAAVGVYTHAVPEGTGHFDTELFDTIREHLFRGVLALVDQHHVEKAFPGTQQVAGPPQPPFQAPQGPFDGPPQPQYQAPPQYAPPPAPASPPPQGPAAGANPPCHRCGAPMSPQRNKRNPKAPDYKCSAGGWDRNTQTEWGCQGAAWLNNGQLKGN